MPETVANLTPSGAGRIIDWIWPGFRTGAGGPNYNTESTSRSGSTGIVGVAVGYGGGGGACPADVANGVPCVRIICGPGVQGNGFVFGVEPMSMFFPTTKSNIVPAVNDEAAYRVVVAMAGSGLAPNAVHDLGIEFIPSSSTSRIAQDGADGFGLRLNSANVVQFIASGGPGGGIVQDLTAAPFDVTAFHTYDFRILAATNVADAQLSLLIDDVPVDLGATNSTWGGPGSHLPPQHLSANAVGFRPNLLASAGNTNFIRVAFLRFMAAPSLAMCF